jgi:hypothetical protein
MIISGFTGSRVVRASHGISFEMFFHAWYQIFQSCPAVTGPEGPYKGGMSIVKLVLAKCLNSVSIQVEESVAKANLFHVGVRNPLSR